MRVIMGQFSRRVGQSSAGHQALIRRVRCATFPGSPAARSRISNGSEARS